MEYRLNVVTTVKSIEGNTIVINDGQITIYATDDGINATPKVNDNASIEVNGGTIKVTMGSGDTDGFDSNGNLYINGGTIDVEAASALDADGTAELNGGTVTVNGEQITEITESRGGGGGGFRGGAGRGRGTGH
ncbi:carbohydrate-binding domain-containing protein [Paenibacillus camerounensis]|uniref:carbohydrate-binding domain-containing protein n=1 Tax=Paenibacillus camerounensis TaxID=1243663 RepID=UPI000A329E33|nr:carbohydrate-binding domain-containing protein [Paenibacillus camerounensis]